MPAHIGKVDQQNATTEQLVLEIQSPISANHREHQNSDTRLTSVLSSKIIAIC